MTPLEVGTQWADGRVRIGTSESDMGRRMSGLGGPTAPSLEKYLLDGYLYRHAAAAKAVVDHEQFQRIAKALADPRRTEILEHIAQQSEVGCRRLCDCFPVRQATISHHLKELASAGLVESRRDGQFVYYRTRPEVLEDYMAELMRRTAIQPGPGPARAQPARGRVPARVRE